MKKESEESTNVLVVGGETIFFKDIKDYYKSVISAALMDIISQDQLAEIVKNSFNKLCLRDSFASEQELHEYLLMLVFEEANEKKANAVIQQIMSLQICFAHFANLSKECKRAIALSDEEKDYTTTLQELEKYKTYLEGIGDNLTAKVVDNLHRLCGKKFLDLSTS